MQKTNRQHEPLRVPEWWKGQDRTLVVQIDRILDDIYNRLGDIESKLKELDARVTELEN